MMSEKDSRNSQKGLYNNILPPPRDSKSRLQEGFGRVYD